MLKRELSGDVLIERAAEIAREAHKGQEHFFGEGSYFEMHVFPVSKIVRRLGYGALFVAGALLHDVPEDTEVTLDDLLEQGIPRVVVQATDLMNKKEGQTQEDYINGIKKSPIAVVGKYVDSAFNFSWTILNSSDISDINHASWSFEYLSNMTELRPLLPWNLGDVAELTKTGV